MAVLDQFRLDGQVVVVTGGGRGIGEAIALGMAEAGADIVVAARRTAEIEAVAEKAPPMPTTKLRQMRSCWKTRWFHVHLLDQAPLHSRPFPSGDPLPVGAVD